MKGIKLYSKLVLLSILLISVSGCFEEQSPYLMESKIDLQNPNGIYEVILYRAVQEAFKQIKWDRYQDKKIFYDVQEITDGYLDNVVAALVEHKFLEAGGKILIVDKTGENKDKSEGQIKRETIYDYDVYITVPITGVYYYEGFLKRNYVAYVMVNLFEKQKDSSERSYSSGVIEKKFEKFIPSKVCIVSLWVLLLSVVILLITKILFQKKINI